MPTPVPAVSSACRGPRPAKYASIAASSRRADFLHRGGRPRCLCRLDRRDQCGEPITHRVGALLAQQIIPIASAALDVVEGRRDQHAVSFGGPLLDLGRDLVGCVRSVVIDQHDVDAPALRLRLVGELAEVDAGLMSGGRPRGECRFQAFAMQQDRRCGIGARQSGARAILWTSAELQLPPGVAAARVSPVGVSSVRCTACTVPSGVVSAAMTERVAGW